MNDWFNTYNLLACFVVICVAVGSFWPYLAGYNNTYLETSPIRRSLVSNENVLASAVAVTLAVPMAIDALMDGLGSLAQSKHSPNASHKRSSHNGDNIVNVFERLLMCFGFIIFPANTLGAINSTSHNVALFALCGFRARLLSVAGAILLSFTRSKSCVTSARLSVFVITFTTLGTSLVAYLSLADKTGGPVQAFGAACQYTAFIVFYLAAVRFLVRGYFQYTNATTPLPSGTSGTSKSGTQQASGSASVAHIGGIFFQDNSDASGGEFDRASLYFTMTYCATVMGCFIAVIATQAPGSGSAFADTSSTAMALQHIGYSVLELGVLVFHLRQVKFAAVTRLVRCRRRWYCQTVDSCLLSCYLSSRFLILLIAMYTCCVYFLVRCRSLCSHLLLLPVCDNDLSTCVSRSTR